MDPWTFEYNSFLFSELAGTCVTEITGFDLPEMRSNDFEIPGQHGAFPGMDRLEPRTFDMTVDVRATNTTLLFDKLHSLSAATGPRDAQIPFTFRLDPNHPEMQIICRPRRRNIPLTQRHIFGNVEVALQFWASDPLFYETQDNIGNTDAASDAGGREFDWSFDWSYQGDPGEAGEVAANNQGTAPTYWIARINGPCENPTIGGPDGFVRWSGSLNAGEYLEFNAHPGMRTVMLGGTSTRYDNLSLDSTWFLLRPGSNSIRFTTEEGDGSLQLRWRSAWWSAT